MKDQPRNEVPQQAEAKPGKAASTESSQCGITGVPAAGATAADSELTPEECWELFEQELKENDWGHQPC